ncbi:Fic family protein [Nocardioides caeni]|uniref:Fic family protein n=1 Tax=Nocardioides caeni TaxID=574700 RepID=UPI0031E7E76F
MDHAAQSSATVAVAWEQREWKQSVERPASRRQQLAARGSYRAAVPAAIADLDVPVAASLQAEAEDAVREIARFDAEVTAIGRRRADSSDAGGVPAAVAPLAAVLLRTESASSSQIEGVTAGARALALAAIDAQVDPNAQLVTANVAAMQRAIDQADRISVTALLAAHRELLAGHDHAAPGELREQQVWIGGSAPSPHGASFVPPHHERVSAAMEDLVAFVGRVDLPVLIQVAVAHAQFETIHPFNDGNGRIGRTLVHAMLRHAGVTQHLTVPVSAGLLTDTDDYFDALTAYRQGVVEPIVRRFVDASFRAIDNGRHLVDDLEAVHDAWGERLPSRRGSAARRLLPHLLSQPAITIGHVEQVTGVALSAAQRAVEQLESAGVVRRIGTGRRNRIWLAPDVIDALDAFAERVGRRG